MTVPLRSERLVLRAHTPADAPSVQDLYSREAVQRYLGDGTARVSTREAALQKITGWVHACGTHPLHGVWAVCGPDGSPVGTLLLKPIPDSGADTSHDVEIGWHFHPDAWGHGYATEAARAVLDHAFGAGLDRVVAVTHPANEASQAVCRRLGMPHLGLSRAYYDAECELYELRAPASRASEPRIPGSDPSERHATGPRAAETGACESRASEAGTPAPGISEPGAGDHGRETTP